MGGKDNCVPVFLNKLHAASKIWVGIFETLYTLCAVGDFFARVISKNRTSPYFSIRPALRWNQKRFSVGHLYTRPDRGALS